MEVFFKIDFVKIVFSSLKNVENTKGMWFNGMVRLLRYLYLICEVKENYLMVVLWCCLASDLSNMAVLGNWNGS